MEGINRLNSPIQSTTLHEYESTGVAISVYFVKNKSKKLSFIISFYRVQVVLEIIYCLTFIH